MKHWSVDTHVFGDDSTARTVWELENAVNFGLRSGKIKRQDILAHWSELDLDPEKKRFLSLILAR